MGGFATITVDEGIELPYFPEEVDRDEVWWQSKSINKYNGPYRITADGRVKRKERTYREKADEEKQAEAERWGYDSWGEYCQAYEDCDGLYPDDIDWSHDDDSDESPPVASPSEQTLDETFWLDDNFHGSFEFHGMLRKDPVSYEVHEMEGGETKRIPDEHKLKVYLSYEARFTKGDLDEIVFLGERLSDSDDRVDAALRKIAEWQRWRDE